MQLRHTLTLTGALVLGSLVPGCGPAEDVSEELPQAEVPQQQTAPGEETGTVESAASTAGFTSHFRTWLTNNGYEPTYNLIRADLVGGSYGGKASSTDTVVNQPVIFIHGNSDKAIGTGTAGQSGWTASVDFFLSKGYKTSELYATTWGPADASLSAYQYHSKTNVMKVRKFIEAVKAYTGATKVDVVTHSMGGLSSRYYAKNLGGDARIDAWVSLGGPNHGTQSAVFCFTTSCVEMRPNSTFLKNLNAVDETPGLPRYATWWSDCDGVISPASSTPISGATNTKTACLSHSALYSDVTVYGQVRGYVHQ